LGAHALWSSRIPSKKLWPPDQEPRQASRFSRRGICWPWPVPSLRLETSSRLSPFWISRFFQLIQTLSLAVWPVNRSLALWTKQTDAHLLMLPHA
jgi:hypothetical protein